MAPKDLTATIQVITTRWMSSLLPVTRTHRKDPIYHSTYTGRPPDEPAVLSVALNEVFIPLQSNSQK